MKALEASVLFGMARGDALREDTQLDPPDGQRGEAAQADAGEGRAVVSPDDLGEAVLAEGGLQDASPGRWGVPARGRR